MQQWRNKLGRVIESYFRMINHSPASYFAKIKPTLVWKGQSCESFSSFYDEISKLSLPDFYRRCIIHYISHLGNNDNKARCVSFIAPPRSAQNTVSLFVAVVVVIVVSHKMIFIFSLAMVVKTKCTVIQGVP